MKDNNSEKVFIKINKNWYETVLQNMKKLDIKKNKNLMTCEWSYWITCYNDKCEEHYKMKKQNQHYSQKLWKYASQNEEKWSKKLLYEILIERQQ